MISAGRPRRFDLLQAGLLIAEPSAPVWLVKGMIEQGSTALLFGDPASGKSLFALAWAACIATGTPWNGRPTKSGVVIYVAGEGLGGIRRRLKALQVSTNIDITNAPLYVSSTGAELITPGSAAEVSDAVAAIAKEHGAPVLTIIDTLHRNMGPGDESNSGDIAQLLLNVDTSIRERFGCAVLIVHHAGHGDKTRARGSSSLRAAVDTEFKVTSAPGNTTEISCTKAKDAEAMEPLVFGIQQVDLPWLDEDGDPVTSVVLEPRGTVPLPKAGRKLSAPQRIALKALERATEEHGDIPPKEVIDATNIGLGTHVVHVDQWRNVAYALGISDGGQDAKRKAFSRARLDLISQGRVMWWDDYCWVSRND